MAPILVGGSRPAPRTHHIEQAVESARLRSIGCTGQRGGTLSQATTTTAQIWLGGGVCICVQTAQLEVTLDDSAMRPKVMRDYVITSCYRSE